MQRDNKQAEASSNKSTTIREARKKKKPAFISPKKHKEITSKPKKYE